MKEAFKKAIHVPVGHVWHMIISLYKERTSTSFTFQGLESMILILIESVEEK